MSDSNDEEGYKSLFLSEEELKEREIKYATVYLDGEVYAFLIDRADWLKLEEVLDPTALAPRDAKPVLQYDEKMRGIKQWKIVGNI
jgi:hypothetical protein